MQRTLGRGAADGGGSTAALYAGLAVVAMIAFLAVVAYGVHIMLTKA